MQMKSGRPLGHLEGAIHNLRWRPWSACESIYTTTTWTTTPRRTQRYRGHGGHELLMISHHVGQEDGENEDSMDWEPLERILGKEMQGAI